MPLLPALRNRCLVAFLATRSKSSQTERKVAAALMELGGQPKDDVIITEGFSIDLIALWKGKQVALEFDGPSHFLTGLHSATGATLLKHRQLHALGWRLVVVPYWEWDEVKDSKAKRHEYLLCRLKQAAGDTKFQLN